MAPTTWVASKALAGRMTPTAPNATEEAWLGTSNWSATKKPDGPTASVEAAVVGGLAGMVTALLDPFAPQVPAPSVALRLDELSINCVKLEKFQAFPLVLTCMVP